MKSNKGHLAVLVFITLAVATQRNVADAQYAEAAAERLVVLKSELAESLKAQHLQLAAKATDAETIKKVQQSRRARHACRDDYQALCQSYIPPILQENVPQRADDRAPAITTVARSVNDLPTYEGHHNLDWGHEAQVRAGKSVKKLEYFEQEAAAHEAKRALTRKRKSVSFLNKYAVSPPSSESNRFNSFRIMDACLSERVSLIANPSCKRYVSSRVACLKEAEAAPVCERYLSAVDDAKRAGDAVPHDEMLERQLNEGRPRQMVGALGSAIQGPEKNSNRERKPDTPERVAAKVKCLKNALENSFSRECVESVYYVGLARKN